MSRGYRYLSTVLLAAALVSPVIISGCASHPYSVYDPYYRDNHVWDNSEVVYYQRWETETHREHREFKRRNADEQKQYWDWRHKHER